MSKILNINKNLQILSTYEIIKENICKIKIKMKDKNS